MADNVKGIRHKSFTYRTSIAWTEGRAGTAASEGRPDLIVSSPPEFKGEPGRWTPEDMLVAAVEACTMTTFLAFAQLRELPLKAYRSTAEGLLEFVDGAYGFTRVTIRPVITVSVEEATRAASQIIHDAHAKCLIANSLRAQVVVEPTVDVRA